LENRTWNVDAGSLNDDRLQCFRVEQEKAVVLSTGVAVARKSTDRKVDKKPTSESRRHGTLVRIAEDVAADAKILASIEGTSMAQLMSELLRPILKKRLDDAYRKRLEGGSK
jgi:hypothetical protein